MSLGMLSHLSLLLYFCVSVHLTFSRHGNLMDYSHIGCKQKQGSAEEIRGRHSGPWPLPLPSLLPPVPNIMRHPDIGGWMWEKKNYAMADKGGKKHRSYNIIEGRKILMCRMIKQKETGRDCRKWRRQSDLLGKDFSGPDFFNKWLSLKHLSSDWRVFHCFHSVLSSDEEAVLGSDE